MRFFTQCKGKCKVLKISLPEMNHCSVPKLVHDCGAVAWKILYAMINSLISWVVGYTKFW